MSSHGCLFRFSGNARKSEVGGSGLFQALNGDIPWSPAIISPFLPSLPSSFPFLSPSFLPPLPFLPPFLPHFLPSFLPFFISEGRFFFIETIGLVEVFLALSGACLSWLLVEGPRISLSSLVGNSWSFISLHLSMLNIVGHFSRCHGHSPG